MIPWLLGHGIGEAGDRVLDRHRFHGQFLVLMACRRRPRFFRNLRRRESACAFQPSPSPTARQKLCHHHGQLLKGEKPIFITTDSVVNLGDCSRGPVNLQLFIPIDIGANHSVETDEVIDVMMGDEHRLQISELLHAKAVIVATIEEQGIICARIIEIQDRITDRSVHQANHG